MKMAFHIMGKSVRFHKTLVVLFCMLGWSRTTSKIGMVQAASRTPQSFPGTPSHVKPQRDKGDERHTCILHDGNCMYSVRLSQGCSYQEGGDVSPRIPNPVQSDYNLRVDDIEQNLISVRQDHTRRLSQLENRINVLLGGEDQSIPPLPPTDDQDLHGSHHRSRHGHGGGGNPGNFKQDPDRSENELLNLIHDEFSGLRLDLELTKDRLKETERLLREAREKANSSQTQLTATTNKLLDAEKRLRKKEQDCARKDGELLDKQRELNDTNTRLRETEQQLTDTQVELLNLKSDHSRTKKRLDQARREQTNLTRKLEDTTRRCEQKAADMDDMERQLNQTKKDLSKNRDRLHKSQIDSMDARADSSRLQSELDDCHADLEAARMLLSRALKKYHQLNVKHDDTTQQLNTTKEDLTECFKGKTSQFCGFEDPNICGFTQDNGTDYLDWTRWNRKTPSSRTGPSRDHTCGNKHGYYMYLEATAKALDQNARLITPRYIGHDEQCVEFYYHMYGNNIGTLNVYTLVKGQDLPPPVWRAYGNQGNVWILARLSIPDTAARAGYQVVFEGFLESGYQGDIAIDDVRVFDGQCQTSKTLDELRLEDEETRRKVLADARKKLRKKKKVPTATLR